MSELDELRDKATKLKETAKTRQREGYAYARQLGFSVYEAMLLQNSSKEKIDRLAKLKDTEAPQSRA